MDGEDRPAPSFAVRTSVALALLGAAVASGTLVWTAMRLASASEPPPESLVGGLILGALTLHLVGIAVTCAAPPGRRRLGIALNAGVPLALVMLVVVGLLLE